MSIFPYIFLFITSSRLFSEMITFPANNIFLTDNAVINFSGSDDSDNPRSSERNVVESPYPEWLTFNNPLAQVTIKAENEYECLFSFGFNTNDEKLTCSYKLKFLPNSIIYLVMKVLFKDFSESFLIEGEVPFYGNEALTPNCDFIAFLESINKLKIENEPWRFCFAKSSHWPLFLPFLFDFIDFDRWDQDLSSPNDLDNCWKPDNPKISFSDTVYCSFLLSNPYDFINCKGLHYYLVDLPKKTIEYIEDKKQKARIDRKINQNFSNVDCYLLIMLLNIVYSSSNDNRAFVKNENQYSWRSVTLGQFRNIPNDRSPEMTLSWRNKLQKKYELNKKQIEEILNELNTRLNRKMYKQYLYRIILFILCIKVLKSTFFDYQLMINRPI